MRCSPLPPSYAYHFHNWSLRFQLLAACVRVNATAAPLTAFVCMSIYTCSTLARSCIVNECEKIVVTFVIHLHQYVYTFRLFNGSRKCLSRAHCGRRLPYYNTIPPWNITIFFCWFFATITDADKFVEHARDIAIGISGLHDVWMLTFRDRDLSRKINKMKKKETNRNSSCVLAKPKNLARQFDSSDWQCVVAHIRCSDYYFFDSTQWNTAPERYFRVCVCVWARLIHGLNGANRQSALAPRLWLCDWGARCILPLGATVSRSLSFPSPLSYVGKRNSVQCSVQPPA